MYKLILSCIILHTAAWPAAAQTLKGTLYYDLGRSRTKPAPGLVVYLIHNTRENSSIIQQYSTARRTYDERVLKSARGSKKAVSNSDGIFYFTNIF